jgi:wobble nucleotide-excising tRNase
VAVLESSKAHSRVAELQKELVASQQVVVAAEKRVTKQQSTDQQIRRAADTLKRVSSEIVDDRLAAIRPLLAELYVRLRPHVDWPEISYLIRGDTRRFLSLRVGDGLNLRFMFSSGQRRAAGLAFLMAVSLSRPWCLLESLVFDDPVQHIDDFRALHLVESLSALRQVGRQIICTVEDSALAELLARRLRSSDTDEGAVVEMDYESGRGSFVGKVSEIRPFSTPILRSA